jgi:hypothetical protein
MAKRHITAILLSLCLLPHTLRAQENGVKPHQWYVPDFVIGQFAGSIGFISAGVGYNIFKDKGTIDLLIGYVPEFATGSKTLESITVKFTGHPLSIIVNEYVMYYPVTAGFYFSYTPGREYSSDLPSWYPDGYYWWSEAVRANIFIGGKVDIAMNNAKSKRYFSPYYEIGTNEIKLVSYVQNASSINIWEILHAGIGVRYHF